MSVPAHQNACEMDGILLLKRLDLHVERPIEVEFEALYNSIGMKCSTMFMLELGLLPAFQERYFGMLRTKKEFFLLVTLKAVRIRCLSRGRQRRSSGLQW